MMQGVFEEISFRSYEDVPKESCKVFSKLGNIEDFHLEGNVKNFWALFDQNIGTTFSS